MDNIHKQMRSFMREVFYKNRQMERWKLKTLSEVFFQRAD